MDSAEAISIGKRVATRILQYPMGRIPPRIDDCTCILPLVAKYAWYAKESVKGKVEDEVVEDLFQAAKDLTGRIDPRIFDNVGKPDLPKQFWDAKSRIDKVVAVETLINLQHESGSVLQFACDFEGVPRGQRLPDNILYQEAISQVLLDLLAGDELCHSQEKK